MSSGKSSRGCTPSRCRDSASTQRAKSGWCGCGMGRSSRSYTPGLAAPPTPECFAEAYEANAAIGGADEHATKPASRLKHKKLPRLRRRAGTRPASFRSATNLLVDAAGRSVAGVIQGGVDRLGSRSADLKLRMRVSATYCWGVTPRAALKLRAKWKRLMAAARPGRRGARVVAVVFDISADSWIRWAKVSFISLL